MWERAARLYNAAYPQCRSVLPTRSISTSASARTPTACPCAAAGLRSFTHQQSFSLAAQVRAKEGPRLRILSNRDTAPQQHLHILNRLFFNLSSLFSCPNTRLGLNVSDLRRSRQRHLQSGRRRGRIVIVTDIDFIFFFCTPFSWLWMGCTLWLSVGAFESFLEEDGGQSRDVFALHLSFPVSSKLQVSLRHVPGSSSGGGAAIAGAALQARPFLMRLIDIPVCVAYEQDFRNCHKTYQL